MGWAYFALRDRYRGFGKRAASIDVTIGGRDSVEPICKSYRVWVRENW